MSELRCQIDIKEEDGILFKRCVRKLLDTTFILKEKDEKLYYFVANESHRIDISTYLKMIGLDVLVDEKSSLAMLVINEEDEETVGLKRANIITFTNVQYHLLLVLWEIYLENLGYDEGNFVEKGDLIDKIKVYDVGVSTQELKAALKLFKKYSFINYDEMEQGEEAKIQLYPSLQFGWDIPQFKTVVNEYLQMDSLTGYQSDNEETFDEEEYHDSIKEYTFD